MKQKYLLGVYDQLIHAIHYNKKVKESEIVSYLKNCSDDSHYLYQIKFHKQKGKILYAHQKRLHNLHPYAPEFINSDCYTKPEFENLVPLVLKELNIPDHLLEFCWALQNDKNILIIKAPCPLEDVPAAHLFFLYCHQIVKHENHKIKSSLNKTFFSLKSEGKIELFIHRKQYALEKLSNSLIQKIDPAVPNDMYSFSTQYDSIDCLKIIHLYLEKLLIFIEKEYRNYHNVNLKVPYRTLLVKALEIEDQLHFVNSRLLESNIDNRLLQLAYQPLLQIATINIQKKITYNEFNYCCAFISELYHHFQQDKENLSESVLKGWLFDLNLNSPEFLDFKTGEMIQKLEMFETDIEKIDVLYHFLKSFNQRQRQSFIKFNKKLPSIKEQVIRWIEEEIEYLSKREKLVVPPFPNAGANESRVKIQTSLSVAQLTYFIKLLMQAKIIIHKNNSDVFRFVADNFITKSATHISAGSVKSKFHNVETGSMKTIRLFIIELMNLTK